MNQTKITKLNTNKISAVALFFIVISIFVYIFAYQFSISYAMNIESYEDKIANLKSEISEKEFQIVEKRRSLDKEIAIEKGFVELEEVVFLKRTSKTALNAVTN